MKKYLTPSLLLGAAALLAACGGGGGDSSAPPPPPATTGTLAISLTDAPACGLDAVNVTVSKVRVHASSSASETDSGWTDMTLSPARKINLLELQNGLLTTLGTTTLAPGHYTQLRLLLDGGANANTVLPTGSGTESPLETPSALQSGIKLVGGVDIVAGQRAEVVIDFDACKSVLTKGNGKYLLRPVVKVMPPTNNKITGFLAPTLLGSHFIVTAQQGGGVVASTTPNPNTGEFSLARLQTGTYTVVITSDNRAAMVIGAVPVASATSEVQLSTAAAPLAPPASVTGAIGGVVTVTPPNPTEPAYVMASQTINNGLPISLGYVASDLVSGAYKISHLPLSAPQYAAYSTTLPLSFAAASPVQPGAGKYQLSAFVVGMPNKTIASVDINTADQLGVNFTLTP